MGKNRIYLGWIGALAYGWAARETPNLLGLAICFLGASFRFWSSGYLRKNNRLAIGGPYSLTRNPLYFGTYVMAVGAAVSLGSLLLTVIISTIVCRGLSLHHC